MGRCKIPFLFGISLWTQIFMVCIFLVSDVSSQSCGPRVSARLLTDIPCDMSTAGYCTSPGSAYPWQSVKRYIYENQGLVRRMYGDERHNSVISKEMQEYRLRYNPHFLETETIVRFGRTRSARRRNKPRRRQSRPQIFTDDPPTETTTSATEETIFRVVTETSVEIGSQPAARQPLVAPTTPSAQEYTTQISSPQELSNTYSASEPRQETASTPSVKVSNDIRNGSVMFEAGTSPGQRRANHNATESTKTPATSSSPYETEYVNAYAHTEVDQTPTDPPDAPVAMERIGVVEDYDYSDLPKSKLSSFSQNSVEEKTKNKDSEDGHKIKPGDKAAADAAHDLVMEESTDDTKVREGEVEDVEEMEEEEQDSDPVPRRGINACPVKNEVIAPYWANNTRGETLALLNVYPFEQYVHFEKCAFENHQMLCREGCRCEQQYRLHRLLAFDPKNECRGIFSDWFRFPSCCVCICYDLTPDKPRTRSRTARVR